MVVYWVIEVFFLVVMVLFLVFVFFLLGVMKVFELSSNYIKVYKIDNINIFYNYMIYM